MGCSTKGCFFGTSVGAWKLAAATQREPAVALSVLAHAYVAQSYGRKATMDDVVDIYGWSDIIILDYITAHRDRLTRQLVKRHLYRVHQSLYRLMC